MLYPEGKNDPRRAEAVEWKHTRAEVARMTAFEAKKAGDLAEENMKKLGIDWVAFEGKQFPYRSERKGEHYRLIWEATQAKVKQNATVLKTLLSTGDLILRPDHHQTAGDPPEWRYFELYMKLREQHRGSRGK
jgi:hypothetical protein